jgi:TrmH family RNA methyltransferase
LLGKHNPRLLDIRKAIAGAALTSDGLLPVEGPNLLAEALRSRLEVLDVLLRRDVLPSSLPALPAATHVYELEESAFRSIQATETSQGVVALVKPARFSIESTLAAEKVRLVILARLQDPGNVGTILRVAEGFGATGCIGLQGTAAIYNSKTVRASAGSIFRLPTFWNLGFADLLPALHERGVAIAGSSPSAAVTADSWEWRKPSAIVIGNEGSGMSAEEAGFCDVLLRIPHNPIVESLNSAVAAAILLYEASRHERFTV